MNSRFIRRDYVHNRTGGGDVRSARFHAAVLRQAGIVPGIGADVWHSPIQDTELEALRVIECLKKAGVEIKDIRLFMEWCAEGPSTYPKRKAMFEQRKAHMESEIANMNRALDMLKFKCWYYEQAIQDGSEGRLKALIPDELPEEIKEAYENAHT